MARLALELAPDRDGATPPGMMHAQGCGTPFARRHRRQKRLLDLIVSVTGLAITSPLLAAIAIAIRLDSTGPVVFAQERVGLHGRRFTMYKFRSMRANSEGSADAPSKQPDDPRVTRVGRVLRRSSLDELPQLLNVLRGDMTLVGPRPELPSLTSTYEPWQWQRACVPAGLTGWWQVNGRSDRPLHLHTDDDLYYLSNCSLRLDLRILLLTIPAVMSGRGAY